ncbi:hypothetical protein Bca52824_069725 [Brassica carinata]|uniref:Uncharacterized protein n=1 Tax=Brassica carinata TaxID=52824 RepID=A0A8X7Q2U2_BRACI|nr:hypothetical protein Bca52824_069725 [Brassica carinata]
MGGCVSLAVSCDGPVNNPTSCLGGDQNPFRSLVDRVETLEKTVRQLEAKRDDLSKRIKVEEDKGSSVEATGCKALNKQCKETTLVNIGGKPWTVALRFSESRRLTTSKGGGSYVMITNARRGLVCHQRGWRWDVITIVVCVCSNEGDHGGEHLEEKVKRWCGLDSLCCSYLCVI